MFVANRLIPAKTAVEALCNVEDDQVSQVLGFPLITKAEPYTAKALPLKGGRGGDSDDGGENSASVGWLITAVVISSSLAVAVLLALLFLIHRQKQVCNKCTSLYAFVFTVSAGFNEFGCNESSRLNELVFASKNFFTP